MKVTTLVENSKGKKGLANEWGLSLHIEANGKSILFDTGMTSAFARNAEKLEVNLSEIDIAILSHGHFDHGGGLATFFSANDSTPLYLRTTADGAIYGRSLFMNRYVGLDQTLLKANGRRLRWVEADTEIAPGIHVLASIPGSERKPNTEKRLLVKTEGGFAPDAFNHELVLVVNETDGASVITGCGHLGVLNMILAVKRKFPDVPIKAVLGGFHLVGNSIFTGMAMNPVEMKEMALRFKELGCQRVISGHCTGEKASSILKNELKEDFCRLSTGMTLEI